MKTPYQTKYLTFHPRQLSTLRESGYSNTMDLSDVEFN